jgi:hypothetical protein
MSLYGQRKLQEAGVAAHYVPHGVDSGIFKLADQAQARQAIGAPDDGRFIAGMVLANKGAPSRKAFHEQIHAFARFHRRHPDSMLYLHTDMAGLFGENIAHICDLAGLTAGDYAVVDQMAYIEGQITEEHMANVYAAMDVTLNATRGEGFGIPIMESQMCGTPVIVGDWTSMSELCLGETSQTVEHSATVYTPLGGCQFIPSVDSIDAALETAYQRRKTTRGKKARRALRKLAMAYDADAVVENYWAPVLQAIEAELKPVERPAPVVVNTPTAEQEVAAVQPAPEPAPEPAAGQADQPARPTYSLLLLTYNRLDAVARCFKSLAPVMARPDVETIVLDNGSADGVPAYLRKLKNARVIFSDKNLGVAAGRERLLKEAAGEFMVFLDSDVVAHNGGWLDALMRAFKDNITQQPGIIGTAGSMIRWDTTGLFIPAAAGQCDVVSGWCQFFPRALLNHARIDTEYGLFYEEDSDFCLQARAAGFAVFAVGGIGLTHHPGDSGAHLVDRAKTFTRLRAKWQGKGLVKSESPRVALS